MEWSKSISRGTTVGQCYLFIDTFFYESNHYLLSWFMSSCYGHFLEGHWSIACIRCAKMTVLVNILRKTIW